MEEEEEKGGGGNDESRSGSLALFFIFLSTIGITVSPFVRRLGAGIEELFAVCALVSSKTLTLLMLKSMLLLLLA